MIDKKKAKKITKSSKKQAHELAKSRQTAESQAAINAKKAAEEKKEKDRQLNLARKAKEEEKALAAQIKQIIEHYKIDNTKGDQKFNFSDEGKIKALYLNNALLGQVTKGVISVVKAENDYQLVPRPVAEKIKTRSPQHVIVDNYGNQPEEEMSEDDSYYAQFEIPDDLMW